jgi:ribosomal protein L21
MNVTRTPRLLTAVAVSLGLFCAVDVALAASKSNHHDGQQLLGGKIKTNGHHVLHKKGEHTVSVEVKGGKIAAVHVKHAKKGDVAVTKYKTGKKMARADGPRGSAFVQVQDQYLGTTYIGFAYVDEYGNEEIYWFPYDMILDGATGAIEYVPAT